MTPALARRPERKDGDSPLLSSIRLIQNIGPFVAVTPDAGIQFAPLTLIYAENGRGKTTLSSILRSLASGDPLPIAERRRLGAQGQPHVVLDCGNGNHQAVYQNGAWSRTLSKVYVFDDVFVDKNVCSGLAVDPEHRQNLHELVLGAEAVAKNRRLQELVARVEEHNIALRRKEEAILRAVHVDLSVEDFCNLPEIEDVDSLIAEVKNRLDAAQKQDPIRTTQSFAALTVPMIDVERLNAVLEKSLASIDERAATQVREHLSSLGPGGEVWVGEGLQRMQSPTPGEEQRDCPFCAQDLAGSPVLRHYREYFSVAYSGLKREVAATISELRQTHGDHAAVEFERAIRSAVSRREFWSQFTPLPAITVDPELVVQAWRSAYIALNEVLSGKQAAPLDVIQLPDEAKAAVAIYESQRQQVSKLNSELQEANLAIRAIQERAASDDPIRLQQTLKRYEATKARRAAAVAPLCEAFVEEQRAKTRTVADRDRVRDDLKRYRESVFPQFAAGVNKYLDLFCTGFRLGTITPKDTRGGPSCAYNVVINEEPVEVGGAQIAGEPSFRSALSAGDRSALALAFFFASLDQDQALSAKAVVIDDPISSLDDHRALTTVQEIRNLTRRTAQVILLSHNKRFLCQLWDSKNGSQSAAFEVAVGDSGSTLRKWNVSEDCVTEHDKRHERMRKYLEQGVGDPRQIAADIRHLLEISLRVSYPKLFPAGKMIRSFINECNRASAGSQETFSRRMLDELSRLNEYTSRYHHDTNPAWLAEQINDTELRSHVNRTFKFIQLDKSGR